MLPSLFISLYTKGGDSIAFMIAIVITGLTGFLLSRKKNYKNQISPRDGLGIVSLGWLCASLLGAIPLYISNSTDTYYRSFF